MQSLAEFLGMGEEGYMPRPRRHESGPLQWRRSGRAHRIIGGNEEAPSPWSPWRRKPQLREHGQSIGETFLAELGRLVHPNAAQRTSRNSGKIAEIVKNGMGIAEQPADHPPQHQWLPRSLGITEVQERADPDDGHFRGDSTFPQQAFHQEGTQGPTSQNGTISGLREQTLQTPTGFEHTMCGNIAGQETAKGRLKSILPAMQVGGPSSDPDDRSFFGHKNRQYRNPSSQ